MENVRTKNHDEITPVATRKNSEKLPPPEQDADENEIEQVNLDPSDQSDCSDEDAYMHPRRTRSHTNQLDSLLEKPMIEEEENVFWI